MQTHHLLSLLCMLQIYWTQHCLGTSGDCVSLPGDEIPENKKIETKTGNQNGMWYGHSAGEEQSLATVLFRNEICFSCKVDSNHVHKVTWKVLVLVNFWLLWCLQASWGDCREGVKSFSLAEERPQLHAPSTWGWWGKDSCHELRDSLTHYKMPSLKQACLAKNRGGWRLNLVRIGEIMFTCYIPLLFPMRVVGVR